MFEVWSAMNHGIAGWLNGTCLKYGQDESWCLAYWSQVWQTMIHGVCFLAY